MGLPLDLLLVPGGTADAAAYAAQAAASAQEAADVLAASVQTVQGLIPNTNTALARATNQAILTAACVPGSHAIIPGDDIYYTDEIPLTGNVILEGEVAFVTQLRNPAGSVLAVEGTFVNVFNLYLRSDGGGHTVRQTGDLDQSHFDQFKLWQSDDNYSVWDNAGFGFVDNRFTRFLSWHTETATVASWNLVAVGGEINDNVWSMFRHQFSGNYAFNVESTDANCQHSNAWEHVNWQVCSGGMLRLIGCRDYRVVNSTLWDLEFTGGLLLRDGILAETNVAGALCIGEIDGHRRLDGACSGAVKDIKYPTGVGKGAGSVLQRAQNITSADPLLVDLNSQDVLVINPGIAASTLTTLSNTSQATLINKDGMTLPVGKTYKIGTKSVLTGVSLTLAATIGTVNANSFSDIVVAAAGAVVGDQVNVSPRSALANGLAIAYAWVNGAGSITFRVINVTAGNVTDNGGAARTVEVRLINAP